MASTLRPLMAAALALLLLAHSGCSELVLVYSVQRHGARNMLPKTALLAETDLVGGPTLLPQGQRQTYSAGVAFRARYLDNATCTATSTCLPSGSGAIPGVRASDSGGDDNNYGALGQPGVGYGSFDVYVRSSALDRTILSANCFFQGVFNNTNPANSTHFVPSGVQLVPVYTQPDVDDVLVRAYTKCPAYQAALTAWYNSSEFLAKAAATRDLRQRVKAAMPSADVTLDNWWNVYDAINVWRTYRVGNPTPDFADDFTQIQELAYWLETSKMRSNLTRNMLGGVMLADVLNNLKAASSVYALGSQAYYKLLSVSAHYNTQLALLAALGVDKAAPDFPWFRSIPRLAAVLVTELHALPSSGPSSSRAYDFYVRMVMQDGPDRAYVPVPLPCATPAAEQAVGAGACRLVAFEQLARPLSFNSTEEWCGACNNVGPVAQCRAQRLIREATRAARTAALAERGSSSCSKDVGVAIGVTLACCAALLMAVLLGRVLLRRRAASKNPQQQQQPFFQMSSSV